MLFEYSYKIAGPNFEKNKNKNKAVMLACKMLPEYIFDTAKLENNPITFPEVKTLIDMESRSVGIKLVMFSKY